MVRTVSNPGHVPGHEPDDSAPSLPATRTATWEYLLMLGIVGIALISRWSTLGHPLTESFAFRQTQTAFQTREFFKHGIDLLSPTVPVFGAPWTIPFEMPLFQALASVPMSWGASAEFANRLTALIFFLLTGLVLWRLVRYTYSPIAATVSVILFTFSPFALMWSRASLIEYLATAAAVGWCYAMIRWRDAPSPRWLTLATISGSVAMVVKMPTALPWVIPAVLYEASKRDAHVGLVTRLVRWSRARLDPGFLTMLIVPAIAGMWWTAHADGLKASSPFTAWLTSDALRSWNLGTIEQRLQADNLNLIFDRVGSLLVGRGWIVFIVFAAVAAGHRRSFWVGMTLVPIFGIGAFYNLYIVHDYYLAAVSPAIAALLGVGIVSGVAWFTKQPAWTAAVVSGVTAMWLGVGIWLTQGYWRMAYDEPPFPGQAAEIEQLTTPVSQILVGGYDWDPTILYYADRRGLMLREPPVTRDLVENLADLDDYRLLYVGDPMSGLVEYGSVLPWYSPRTGNSLLLAPDPKDLVEAQLIGSTLEESPFAMPVDIEPKTLLCDATSSILLPEGEGSLRLRIQTSGPARVIMSPGLVPVPSASRTLTWHAPTPGGLRPATPLSCVGGGHLTIEESSVDPRTETG